MGVDPDLAKQARRFARLPRNDYEHLREKACEAAVRRIPTREAGQRLNTPISVNQYANITLEKFTIAISRAVNGRNINQLAGMRDEFSEHIREQIEQQLNAAIENIKALKRRLLQAEVNVVQIQDRR
jgi:hypothetical protein